MTQERAKPAIKKKKPGSYPYLSVVFSMTLALFVLGLFALLLLHANRLTELIKENIEVQIYLEKSITDNDRIKIEKTIRSKVYLDVNKENGGLRFISKQEAADKFINETGEDFMQFLGENPLRDAFVLKIKSAYYQEDKLDKIKSELEATSGVYQVSYVKNLIETINSNITKISLVLFGFAIILFLIVIILINNTIKLALFSQRFLIRSMQLVGATRGFIQRPFLVRSIFHGLLAGILASILLLSLLQYANMNIPELALLQDGAKINFLFLITCLLGGVVGFFSTLRSIRKYIGMSLDELY